MKLRPFLGLAAMICAGAADVTLAQFGSSQSAGVVSGTGVVTIVRQPEIMRLQVDVQGKAATLKDALGLVKKRIEKAREVVVALGADKQTIQVDAARIAPAQNNNAQRRMEMMMAQQLRSGGKSAKKSKVTPPVTVSAKFTAEWKLKAKEGDELLVSVNAIQEKIKAAELSGADKAEAATLEEQEVLEEESAEMGNFGMAMGNEPKPGEPFYIFIVRVNEEERTKALENAFQKASKDALRLARAAKADLGNLRSLTSHSGSGADPDTYAYDGTNMQVYRTMQALQRMQKQGRSDDDAAAEAVGAEPSEVHYTVTVIASFDIESKK